MAAVLGLERNRAQLGPVAHALRRKSKMIDAAVGATAGTLVPSHDQGTKDFPPSGSWLDEVRLSTRLEVIGEFSNRGFDSGGRGCKGTRSLYYKNPRYKNKIGDLVVTL